MECDPILDEQKTSELIQILNSDSNNGMMYFLIGMSKLYISKRFIKCAFFLSHANYIISRKII